MSNAEYGGSIDFSTICKKRRLLTGTIDAIQAALPDTVLTANDFLAIRDIMKKNNSEVNCGLCYVEGSRAKMGEYASQFIELIAKSRDCKFAMCISFSAASSSTWKVHYNNM